MILLELWSKPSHASYTNQYDSFNKSHILSNVDLFFLKTHINDFKSKAWQMKSAGMLYIYISIYLYLKCLFVHAISFWSVDVLIPGGN